MDDRVKLNTAIEKSIHKFLFQVKENMYDHVHLYIRRNKLDLDHNQIEEVLKIAKLALEEGELTKFPYFFEEITKSINEFTQAETGPLVLQPEPNQENPSLKPLKKVAFHL